MANTTHMRAHRKNETLEIKCNNTVHETWYLTCVHDGWIGEFGNCSAGKKGDVYHILHACFEFNGDGSGKPNVVQVVSPTN